MIARCRRWIPVCPVLLALSACAGHAIDDSEPAPQWQIASAGASAQTPLAEPTRCGERLAAQGLAMAPPKPSASCGVAAQDASSICDGIRCPVSRAFEFSCTGGGYGPSVVPSGGHSSVTLFVTNAATFEAHLFSVDAQGARAEDVQAPLNAVNLLASDPCGRVSVFAGEAPGIQLISAEAPAKWRRQEVVPVSHPAMAMLADARTGADSLASAAYYQLDDNLPRLAARENSVWSTRVLANTRVSSMGLDVDDQGDTWVAWLRDGEAGLPTLELAAPDGSIHPVASGVSPELASFWRKPVVLSGGITGQSAYPALAAVLADGVHLWTTDATSSIWTDRVLSATERSADARGGGDCEFGDSPADPCNGKTSCTRLWNETSGRLGLVRTKSGRAFAAWIQTTAEVNYALTPSVNTHGATCETRIAASRGSAEVVVAALAEGPNDAPNLTRLRFDVGGPSDGGGLSLAVRGDSLLLAASLGGAGKDAKLSYLELDSTLLASGDTSNAGARDPHSDGQ